MSVRDRGAIHYVVTGLALAAIFGLVAILVYETAVSHTERKLRAEQSAENYAQDADASIESRCFILDPVPMAECIKQEIEASNDASRSEYDLSAQQDMSEWAFWLLWVGVATVAITAVGVGFVWRTLLYTRDTLKEAREATAAASGGSAINLRIGEAQVRAYISITKVKLTAQNDTFNLTFWYQNTGASPAKHLEIAFSMRCRDGSSNFALPAGLEFFHPGGTVPASARPRKVRHGPMADDQTSLSVIYSLPAVEIIFRIVFLDVFDETVREETSFVAWNPAGHLDKGAFRAHPRASWMFQDQAEDENQENP